MLLIPDLHLEPVHTNRIISTLQTIIINHHDDSVVFLGDYIYHFSYHKPSLLSFLSLCLDCASKGKHIYILAGNHDRLGSEFVFQEAKMFVDHLTHNNLAGSLTFITKPCVMYIHNQPIAFLPSCINTDDYRIDNPNQSIYETNAYSFPIIASRLQSHANADTKQLRYSYAINNRLMYQDTTNLIIIHHRYIGPCRIPGLKTQFGLDNGALHAERLKHPTRRFVSGHIHTPFVFGNRACLGSFWHTSQTEYNHPKVWGHRDSEKNILILTPVTINPIIRLHASSISSVTDLSHYRITYREQRKNTAIQTNQRTIHYADHTQPSPNELSVHLTLDPGTDPQTVPILDELNNHVAGLRWSFEKENHIGMTIDDLNLDTSTLTTSLLNRRNLLIERIKTKYPESHELYLAILRELDIIK